MLESLVGSHERVLVLDGHDLVIACDTEVGDHISPVVETVTVAYTAEDPGAVSLVAVMLRIEDAELRGVVLVDLRILRVEVIDSALELADSRYGIDALPDKVRGVEVCADNVADCRSELEKSFGIIYAESGVHLKCDMLNSVLYGKLTRFLPIRDQLFVPLSIEDLKEILGPRTRYPVRIF